MFVVLIDSRNKIQYPKRSNQYPENPKDQFLRKTSFKTNIQYQPKSFRNLSMNSKNPSPQIQDPEER